MVRDWAYDWIAAQANRLDPRGYVEETRSLKFFGHQQVTYGLEIVAIIDWARKYLELGMIHPLPTLPMYLFSSFVASRQTANSPLKKDDGMYTDTDDIRERFHRGWILMAAVLQFWTDEQSILDGEIKGGRIRPASALAQYVMKSLNHLVPKDLQITWEQIVERTPWVRKCLDATEDESRAIFRQLIPVTGEVSALEVATEKCYKREVEERSAAPRDTLDARAAPSLPAGETPRPPVGRGAILKAKLDKMNMGKGCTRLPGKESGPDMGQPYEPRRRRTDEDPTILDNPDDTKGAEATGENPSHSPLSRELDPQSEVTSLLDYDDVVDQDLDGDPETATAVASILAPEDVEMKDAEAAPGAGFNPELMRLGFDQHFARGTAADEPGSTSPVIPRDDALLNDPVGRAPGDGRPGSSENSGRKITGQK